MSIEPPNRAFEIVLRALRRISHGEPGAQEIAEQALDDFIALADESDNGQPPSLQPDLDSPAQALAHRVQQALEREFDDEPVFPCCVVVQEPRTRSVGIAATAIPLEDVKTLLLMGRGAVQRVIRQHQR